MLDEVGRVAMMALPATPSALDIGWRMAVCGIGFGFFQAPNVKAIMGSAPASRAGSASGMVATARLTGQATGAALVAFCLTISHVRGPWFALGLAIRETGDTRLVDIGLLKLRGVRRGSMWSLAADLD